MTYIPSAGGGGGGGGEVLFKWNGTDLSQLLDTANLSVGSSKTTMGANADRTAIIVDVPGAGGTYGMRRFDIDLPRRYRLRFTIGQSVNNHIDGIAVNVQDPNRYMAFGHYGATTMSIYGRNDPTPVWPGSTPGIVSSDRVSQWDVLFESIDADGANPPRFRLFFNEPGQFHREDADWWAAASSGSGWLTPGQVNGLGIAWLNNGGGHTAFAIWDIVVTTHPADL